MRSKHTTGVCKCKGLNICYTDFFFFVKCENEQDIEDHTNFWSDYDDTDSSVENDKIYK